MFIQYWASYEKIDTKASEILSTVVHINISSMIKIIICILSGTRRKGDNGPKYAWYYVNNRIRNQCCI